MAHLYSPRLQIPQCYKCQQWGHTQISCRARTTCGFCAQGHNTRECKDLDKVERKKCANCTGNHAAWERGRCPKYRYKKELREELRLQLLYEEAERMRSFNQPREDPRTSQNSTQNKRKRAETIGQKNTESSTPQATQEDVFKRPGRPRWTDGQAGGTQLTLARAISRSRERERGGEEGEGEERGEMDCS